MKNIMIILETFMSKLGKIIGIVNRASTHAYMTPTSSGLARPTLNRAKQH